MFKFSERSKNRMKGVNPVLVEIMEEAIDISPIDFGIPPFGGLRTAEDQHGLFVSGKSKADGYKKLSNHQSGNAIDVYAYVNGKASWDSVHLAIIAGVVLSVAQRKSVDVRWGGEFGSNNFHGWDKPHFELK